MEIPNFEKITQDVAKHHAELQGQYLALHKKIIADYEARVRHWEEAANARISEMIGKITKQEQETAKAEETVAEETIKHEATVAEAVNQSATDDIEHDELVSKIVSSAAFQQLMASAINSTLKQLLAALVAEGKK